METRCRLCAESSSNQLPILHDLEFRLKIFQLFQIKVSVEDNLPSSVCQICYDMVGKTWEFNDRIQKAQALLNDLVSNNSTILSPAEPVQPQTVLDTQILNTQNEVAELNYIDTKPTVKCDFNIPDTVNDLSDSSEKSEHRRKTLRTKNKVRYFHF